MAAPPSPSLPSALRLSLALWLCVACAAESGGRVPLARFDGLAHRLDHLWVEQNDPVMGGRSSGGCAVNQSNASLVFYGERREGRDGRGAQSTRATPLWTSTVSEGMGRVGGIRSQQEQCLSHLLW